MAAKKAVIPTWTAADLGLKPEEAGSQGARVKLARSAAPPPRPAGTRIAGATPAQTAEKLVAALIERKLI
jgi:electron transfer flavoprotein alpha/beta subunit